ncbi:MAG TPA: selenocysteine-specific translation elongation factor [Desulfotomaculum sp.]|nr:MAG: Selenocysteine-specific translation elongation factor [Desulfotomaculum sp. 46_80]HAG11958.1 selenocysteine-specific translation elongation factor [Desulfotomaculum sp.]HBY04740.1 selenocysteine-specific translation elongation factor [Desulfotomaculum sp.]
MTNIIIGTAGHVDHGKTALIKALTGIDTDRLKMEKERGISIELGFAFCRLPSGRRAGIVDVPGHERFIKNMLAGVAGIDLVLLVIAADEGVMPQTREHMDIVRLLQINRGIVALTKVDLVDEDFLKLVREDVNDFLKDTPLKDSPVVEVSAVTGQGLEELLKRIDEVPVEGKDTSGQARLPVDRAFSVTGFGTVVTGTLWSGVIHTGDNLEIMPQGLVARVRSLQVHGEKVKEATAGQRVAVNVAGVGVEQAQRGSVLAKPGFLRSANRLDARISLLENVQKELENRTRLHFYLGTAEILCRVILLDREKLLPGETAYAQFLLEEPVAGIKGDRFVFRSYSPVYTLGGGIIVDSASRKHKRMREEIIEALVTRELGLPAEQVESYLKSRKTIQSRSDISRATGIKEEETEQALRELSGDNKVYVLTVDHDHFFISREIYKQWVEKLTNLLKKYHQQYPLREGFPREELRSRLFARFTTRQLQALLRILEEENILSQGPNTVALKDFQPKLEDSQQEIVQRIEDIFNRSGFQPPDWESVSRGEGVSELQSQEVLQHFLRQGTLVKAAEGLYFHAAAIESAKKLLTGYLEKNNEISIGEIKNLLNVSRKYALPLLEYFDRIKVTKRVGDKRFLIKSKTTANGV